MWHASQLALHGSVILLVGLLCGAPLGSAVARGRSEDTIRAWRVAHSSLVMGGILLLAVAGIFEKLTLAAWASGLLAWALVTSSYVFAVVLPFGARYGHRGLKYQAPLANRLMYLGNTLGALGLLVGTVVLVVGAYAAL